MNADIKRIACHYGGKHQRIKTIEELAELIQALAKYSPNQPLIDIIEEIADVEIMLEQLKFLLMIPDEVIGTAKRYKISRTLKRMKK